MGDIKISTEDFGTLAICAIRYCQGRMSYMPNAVRKIIKPYLDKLEDRDITAMLNDCRLQADMNLYGDEQIDKPGWLIWEQDLLQEIDRRGL